MNAGQQGEPRSDSIGRGIGGLATGIAAGLMAAAVRKEREHGDSPRSGEKVWRNSYTEGQLEDRLWRPVGIGKDRGKKRGARRLMGAILQAAEKLELRTLRERQAKKPGVRNGVLGDIGLRVLKALYEIVDFKTGRLEPSIHFIAERIGKSYAAVHNALDRLRQRGFLSWIRRSRPTDNEGQVGPQVEQITNAYALRIPAELQDHLHKLLGDAPTPDCERWRHEQAAKDLDALIATVTASKFHHDFWSGDKLTGESFASIAAGLDRQERESSTSGETVGSF
jgi:antitoxin component of MazEF toxin-antitoxin module